jgi:hypothetical protein
VNVQRSLALLVLGLALAAGPAGCSSTERPATTQSPPGPVLGTSPCSLPEEIEFADWIPKDLPIPKGTYETLELETSLPGGRQGLFVVPGSVTDLTTFIAREWLKAGWEVQAGAEGAPRASLTFSKETIFGEVRARDAGCNPNFTLMTLTVQRT